MSVRAYRRIKMELAEDSSFNMWHDNDLLDFFEDGEGYSDYRNEDGGGCIEINVELLEKALNEYKWEEEDYRKDAIKKDIEWAKEKETEWVIYECY